MTQPADRTSCHPEARTWSSSRPWQAATAGPPGSTLTSLSTTDAWWAVSSGPVPIEGLAAAYADAVDSLRVVPAVVPPRRVVPITDVALERALVADPRLAALGAARWLDPLAGAGRGGPELITTLEAWLASGQSVVATARSLRVAPRTVSYRLARISTVLGVPKPGRGHACPAVHGAAPATAAGLASRR